MSSGVFRSVLALTIGFGFLVAEPVSFAKKSRCESFQNTFNRYQTISNQRGYSTLTQPIAATKAASNAKIAEYKSFLATMELTLKAWGNGAGCGASADAQESLATAKEHLKQLMEYTGPWGAPEIKVNSPARVSNFFELDLPCRTGDSPAAFRTCADLIADFTSKLEAQVKSVVDLDYKGGFNLDGSGNAVAVGSSHPVCNPLPGFTGVANSGAELNQNHYGTSCGSFTSFKMRIRGRSCVPMGSSDLGDKPNGYVMGMMVRARDCHWAQMKNELQKGKIKLSAATGLDPRQKYQKQLNGDSLNYTGLLPSKEKFLKEPNLDKIDLCDPKNKDYTANQQDPGFNSACHLQTERAALEAQYLNIAMLELSDRAQRSYERFRLGTQGRDFFTEFQFYLQSQTSRPRCRGHRGDCNPNAYLNRCLIPSWNDFFYPRANSVWSAEVCQ